MDKGEDYYELKCPPGELKSFLDEFYKPIKDMRFVESIDHNCRDSASQLTEVALLPEILKDEDIRVLADDLEIIHKALEYPQMKIRGPIGLEDSVHALKHTLSAISALTVPLLNTIDCLDSNADTTTVKRLWNIVKCFLGDFGCIISNSTPNFNMSNTGPSHWKCAEDIIVMISELAEKIIQLDTKNTVQLLKHQIKLMTAIKGKIKKENIIRITIPILNCAVIKFNSQGLKIVVFLLKLIMKMVDEHVKHFDDKIFSTFIKYTGQLSAGSNTLPERDQKSEVDQLLLSMNNKMIALSSDYQVNKTLLNSAFRSCSTVNESVSALDVLLQCSLELDSMIHCMESVLYRVISEPSVHSVGYIEKVTNQTGKHVLNKARNSDEGFGRLERWLMELILCNVKVLSLFAIQAFCNHVKTADVKYRSDLVKKLFIIGAYLTVPQTAVIYTLIEQLTEENEFQALISDSPVSLLSVRYNMRCKQQMSTDVFTDCLKILTSEQPKNVSYQLVMAVTLIKSMGKDKVEPELLSCFNNLLLEYIKSNITQQANVSEIITELNGKDFYDVICEVIQLASAHVEDISEAVLMSCLSAAENLIKILTNQVQEALYNLYTFSISHPNTFIQLSALNSFKIFALNTPYKELISQVASTSQDLNEKIFSYCSQKNVLLPSLEYNSTLSMSDIENIRAKMSIFNQTQEPADTNHPAQGNNQEGSEAKRPKLSPRGDVEANMESMQIALDQLKAMSERGEIIAEHRQEVRSILEKHWKFWNGKL